MGRLDGDEWELQGLNDDDKESVASEPDVLPSKATEDDVQNIEIEKQALSEGCSDHEENQSDSGHESHLTDNPSLCQCGQE